MVTKKKFSQIFKKDFIKNYISKLFGRLIINEKHRQKPYKIDFCINIEISLESKLHFINIFGTFLYHNIQFAFPYNDQF